MLKKSKDVKVVLLGDSGYLKITSIYNIRNISLLKRCWEK